MTQAPPVPRRTQLSDLHGALAGVAHSQNPTVFFLGALAAMRFIR